MSAQSAGPEHLLVSERSDGDIRLVAGATVRVVSSMVFNGPNALGVFKWVEENCNLERHPQEQPKINIKL